MKEKPPFLFESDGTIIQRIHCPASGRPTEFIINEYCSKKTTGTEDVEKAKVSDFTLGYDTPETIAKGIKAALEHVNAK